MRQVFYRFQQLSVSNIHNGLITPPSSGRFLHICKFTEYHQFFLAVSVFLILSPLLPSISVFHQSRQGSNRLAPIKIYFHLKKSKNKIKIFDNHVEKDAMNSLTFTLPKRYQILRIITTGTYIFKNLSERF